MVSMFEVTFDFMKEVLAVAMDEFDATLTEFMESN